MKIFRRFSYTLQTRNKAAAVIKAALLCGICAGVGSHLVINTTNSLPGLIYIKTYSSPVAGSIVQFKRPESAVFEQLKAYYADKGQDIDVPRYFMKKVAAVDRGQFQVTDAGIEVDRVSILGTTPLPFAGKRELKRASPQPINPGQMVVYANAIPTSVDSRYFGPVDIKGSEARVLIRIF